MVLLMLPLAFLLLALALPSPRSTSLASFTRAPGRDQNQSPEELTKVRSYIASSWVPVTMGASVTARSARHTITTS